MIAYQKIDRALLCLLLIWGCFSSQLVAAPEVPEYKEVVDSLVSEINMTDVDTVKYDLYTEIYREVRAYDYEASIVYLKEQLLLAEKLESERKEASVNSRIGGAYLQLGNSDDALPFLERAKVLYEKLDLPAHLVNNFNNLALLYQRKNEYEKAIEFYQQSIILSDSLQDYVGTVYTELNLMSLFMDLDDSEKALEHYAIIESTIEKIPEDDEDAMAELAYALPAIYVNAGQSQQDLNQLDSAVTLYNKGLESIETLDEYSRNYWNGYLKNSLGDNFYLRTGELAEGIDRTDLNTISKNWNTRPNN